MIHFLSFIARACRNIYYYYDGFEGQKLNSQIPNKSCSGKGLHTLCRSDLWYM